MGLSELTMYKFIEGSPKACSYCMTSTTKYVKLDRGLFVCDKCINRYNHLLDIYKNNKSYSIIDGKAINCSICQNGCIKHIILPDNSICCSKCLNRYHELYKKYINKELSGFTYRSIIKLFSYLESLSTNFADESKPISKKPHK